MRKRLYRGTRASAGGLQLARRMGIPAVRRQGTGYRPRRGDLVINWGTTEVPGAYIQAPVRWLNNPESVATAVCKLRSLQTLLDAGVRVPEFTTDRHTAQDWAYEGLVIVRTKLRASGGAGIKLVRRDPDDDNTGVVPRAPLYTKYFKGRDEFRVHVIAGEVVDVQQKRRRRDDNGENNATNEIRNLENGWVFCRDNVVGPQLVLDQGIAAVRALELDFGAVDIKCNRQGDRCAVLEVNTAPGLEGSSLDTYATNLRRMIR